VPYEFRLPDIGEGLTEAEVTEWLVDLGQEVSLDQPLVQIETDKAVTDIPAPQAGVLLHQGAPAGAVIQVGDILAVIGEAGEGWPGASEGSGPGATPPEALPIVGTLAEASGSVDPAASQRASSHRSPAVQRPQVLPLIRKLAKDLGVNLSTVRGTGPDGRITRDDVEAAATDHPRSPGSVAGEERVRLSRLRRTIAENMSRSWREIPHVTAFDQADASRLLAGRKSLAEGRPEPLPLEALFIRAVLPALRAHSEFNATLDGEDLVVKRRYDIGIAVDTPEGLVVAVVKDAEGLGLWALAKEVSRLTDAARDRTATVADLSGATFTISNIGAVGGGFGTPIIPYRTTAILSFGRVEEKPVARLGHLEIAPMLPLSLSYDHRVIDGALGRRFLADVIRDIERPDGIVPVK
jgi:pyruvate dehydrogenase E2 component (dihydrolipoamide acetyltransferase)